MCQSSVRGRCRLLRHPSAVRLIAPTRHLPLPPAPPIQSSSRGEENAGGGRRPLPPTSLHTGVRAAGGSGDGGALPRREARREGAPAGGAGGPVASQGPAEL